MFFRIMLFLASTCFFSRPEAAESTPNKKTICLNMIVKNESRVIEACLASVKPWIDYWVIVDTGSDDNTMEIIRNCMKDIPGELHERSWVDFSHNRNEALSLAKNKGDYVLLIDADEVLQCSKDFSLPVLEKDLYLILVRQIGIADIQRNGLINNYLDWDWKGVIHEVISCSEMQSAEILRGVLILYNTHKDGCSGRSRDSQTVKYLRDAELLERLLQEDPNNSRYVYHLAVSYMGAEKYELAKETLERRILLPSSDLHETYLAIYFLGHMKERLNDFNGALASFARAYTWHPVCAEPLVHSARIYREKGKPFLGYLLSKQSLTHPVPEEDPYIEYLIYDHVRLIEFVNCALAFGQYKEALDGCAQLLTNPNLPEEYRQEVLNAHDFARHQVFTPIDDNQNFF